MTQSVSSGKVFCNQILLPVVSTDLIVRATHCVTAGILTPKKLNRRHFTVATMSDPKLAKSTVCWENMERNVPLVSIIWSKTSAKIGDQCFEWVNLECKLHIPWVTPRWLPRSLSASFFITGYSPVLSFRLMVLL